MCEPAATIEILASGPEYTEGEDPMSNAPIYTSKCSAKSLWQEYRIYDDRAEFHTWFGPWVVPFDQVERVEISEPLLKAVLHLRADTKHWPQQIKLDTPDLHEHVTLDKNEGLIRKVFFTPDEPTKFRKALDEAVRRFREKQRDKSK
jgi:hypothetical protein